MGILLFVLGLVFAVLSSTAGSNMLIIALWDTTPVPNSMIIAFFVMGSLSVVFLSGGLRINHLETKLKDLENDLRSRENDIIILKEELTSNKK